MWNLKNLLRSYLSLPFQPEEFTLSELRDLVAEIYKANRSQIPPEFSCDDLLSMAIEYGFIIRLGNGKYKIDL